jgi:hypothetical protein
VKSADGRLIEKGIFAFATTDRGKQQTFRTSHKEEKRHSGHYTGKTEDISDTTQGRQKTFRTPHRKTEDIPDTT